MTREVPLLAGMKDGVRECLPPGAPASVPAIFSPSLLAGRMPALPVVSRRFMLE